MSTAAPKVTATTSARWGLISTARVNRHIIAVHGVSQKTRVVAVASRSLETAKAYADANATATGTPLEAFASYESLLASPNVDCVYISTPNAQHVALAVRAAECKKHILCEKPMALKTSEVKEMFAAAEKHGVVLQEGYMNLHSAVNHKAAELIRSGAIGSVVAMHGIFTYKESRGGFRVTQSLAEGGGALWDVGCYVVSLARFLAGREPSAVHCVQDLISTTTTTTTATANDSEKAGAAATSLFTPSNSMDMSTTGTLMFPKNAASSSASSSPLDGPFSCQFFCSFNAPLQMGFTVVGTTGTLRIKNPFKPDPTKAEEISIQHDIAEPPKIITMTGSGGEGYLYQTECDAISDRVIDAANNSKSTSFLLSKEFSVGNAAVIEALIRAGASPSGVEKVVV